jgi:hypothetical protein
LSGTLSDFIRHQVVLKVDFDLLRDDGRARVSMRFQKGLEMPDPGDLVYLLDGRGNGCAGVVEDVDGWYLIVHPDWKTWVGGAKPSTARR